MSKCCFKKRSTVPSSPHQHRGTLGVESVDTHKVYTGPSTGSQDLCKWITTSARKQVRTTDIWAPSLQEESLPGDSNMNTETQERARLPGLLIEAKINTWGTRSNQRQLQQLTTEITRWQKANVRILLTETKTTHHHQNPALPPCPVQDTPTHPKS